MPPVNSKLANGAGNVCRTLLMMEKITKLSKRLNILEDIIEQEDHMIKVTDWLLLDWKLSEIEKRLKQAEQSLNQCIKEARHNDWTKKLFDTYIRLECDLRSDAATDKFARIDKLNADLKALKCPSVDALSLDMYAYKDLIDRMSKEVEDVEKKLKKGFMLRRKLEKIQRPVDSVRGQFLFRIEQYQEKRSVAYHKKSSECISFRLKTSKHGYNILFKVFPNGTKDGTNSYLSVSIALMKGEYDALLKWPFSQKITIRLINQTNNNYIKADIRPISNRRIFKRPSSFCNPDFLISQFVHIGCLDAESGFCLEDSILLSVSVDMAGITDPADICEENAYFGVNTVIAQATD